MTIQVCQWDFNLDVVYNSNLYIISLKMGNVLKSQQLTIPELWCNLAKTEQILKSLNSENTAVAPHTHAEKLEHPLQAVTPPPIK